MAERMAEELRQAMEMMEQCQQSHSHSQTTGRMREELRQNMEQWQQNPEDERMEDFRQFKEQWERNPTAIFDSFLRSFGSMLWKNQDPPNRPNPSRDDDDEIVESDIELDDSDVVPPDNDPPQKMGDSSTEVTEEKQEAAQVSKSKAMDAISQGKLEDAIDHFTDAITLNPKSAILYANRASIYIKLKKPNAAIRDADAALQINPDSAKGHKVRGMARAMLGLWKEAASDLHVASALDFDEEIDVMLKKVEPNAKKIEDHHKKYLRLRKEKELRKAELERKNSQPKSQDAEADPLLKDEAGKINNHENKEEGEDRLSKLPDPLLLQILSLINYEKDFRNNPYRAKSQATKEVIRTSVLSKRWQFLWTGMTEIGFEERSKEMDKISRFMSRVGDMLDKCSVSHLSRFCVGFYGDKCFSPNLDSWVQTAVERDVEQISLYCYGWKSERSELPHMLYSHSSLTSLSVACWAMTPRETVNWKSVKSLSIGDVNLSDCVMEKISSGCPALEVLRLRLCWGFTCLNILSPSFKTLEIVIRHYTPTIDISAPYLLELEIENAPGKWGVETEQVTQFRLREITSLIRASICFSQSTEVTRVYMVELLQSLQHVKELELGNGCIKSLSRSGGLNVPLSTRRRRLTLNLELKGSFHGILCMLKSSPNIETLTIESSSCNSLGLENNPEPDEGIYKDLVFPNLKTINISLPRGDNVQTLAQILLKSAKVLQKMNLAFERFDYEASEQREKDLLALPRSSPEAIVEVTHIEIW